MVLVWNTWRVTYSVLLADFDHTYILLQGPSNNPVYQSTSKIVCCVSSLRTVVYFYFYLGGDNLNYFTEDTKVSGYIFPCKLPHALCIAVFQLPDIGQPFVLVKVCEGAAKESLSTAYQRNVLPVMVKYKP